MTATVPLYTVLDYNFVKVKSVDIMHCANKKYRHLKWGKIADVNDVLHQQLMKMCNDDELHCVFVQELHMRIVFNVNCVCCVEIMREVN